LVLFDSRFDLPGTYASTHPQVEVSFPASADEALIELAGQQANLVVITSDRRVREEAGRRGAVGLWGEALIDWLQ
jgi:rRNA-processing protein FCF1